MHEFDSHATMQAVILAYEYFAKATGAEEFQVLDQRFDWQFGENFPHFLLLPIGQFLVHRLKRRDPLADLWNQLWMILAERFHRNRVARFVGHFPSVQQLVDASLITVCVCLRFFVDGLIDRRFVRLRRSAHCPALNMAWSLSVPHPHLTEYFAIGGQANHPQTSSDRCRLPHRHRGDCAAPVSRISTTV